MTLLERCEALRLGRNNLFDLVRLYAAVQVLLVHGQVHLGWQLPGWASPFLLLPGVPLFFSISGFLIGLSWIRLRHKWPVYAWHRALRIFPGLWFCLACTVLLLWNAGERSFLLSSQGLIWLLGQATVVQFFNPEPLRDLGVGVINGSLWTIPVELQFYAALPALFVVSSSVRARIFLLGWPLISGLVSYGAWLALPFIATHQTLLSKLIKISLLPHFFQFLLGLAVVPVIGCIGRLRTTRLLLVMAVLIAVAGQVAGSPLQIIQPLLWSSLPIGVGLIPWRIPQMPDLSYGLYLFHMPVVNALIYTGRAGPQSIGPCFVAVLILAGISWYLIEKPALSLKTGIQALLANT